MRRHKKNVVQLVVELPHEMRINAIAIMGTEAWAAVVDEDDETYIVRVPLELILSQAGTGKTFRELVKDSLA